MPLNHADYFMTALAVYREAGGEPREGQVAVAWNIRNRTFRNNTSPYAEVIRKWQFTSITGDGDVNLTRYAADTDLVWINIQIIASSVLEGSLTDPTDGANLYYNPRAIKTSAFYDLPTGERIPFPHNWNPDVVTFKVQIGKHYFFKEP